MVVFIRSTITVAQSQHFLLQVKVFLEC